jgi:uncharacterized protein (TIGR03437 family)
MLRACTVLALALSGVASGAAPSYSAAGIVNSGNYSPAPFAPNSVVTIFGSGLARSSQALSPSDIVANLLPVELNFTQVFVDNFPVPLFYVSDSQVNFLVPSKQATGSMLVRVMREGISGPEVSVPVVAAAPALFATDTGFAIAVHSDNIAVVTADAPAHAGEVIVLYTTGLGKTVLNPATGELPMFISEIENRATLNVTLAGVPVDPARIVYAGLTPRSAGLYQINLVLPSCPVDPEVRVTVAGVTSSSGLKLAIR